MNMAQYLAEARKKKEEAAAREKAAREAEANAAQEAAKEAKAEVIPFPEAEEEDFLPQTKETRGEVISIVPAAITEADRVTEGSQEYRWAMDKLDSMEKELAGTPGEGYVSKGIKYLREQAKDSKFLCLKILLDFKTGTRMAAFADKKAAERFKSQTKKGNGLLVVDDDTVHHWLEEYFFEDDEEDFYKEADKAIEEKARKAAENAKEDLEEKFRDLAEADALAELASDEKYQKADEKKKEEMVRSKASTLYYSSRKKEFDAACKEADFVEKCFRIRAEVLVNEGRETKDLPEEDRLVKILEVMEELRKKDGEKKKDSNKKASSSSKKKEKAKPVKKEKPEETISEESIIDLLAAREEEAKAFESTHESIGDGFLKLKEDDKTPFDEESDECVGQLSLFDFI